MPNRFEMFMPDIVGSFERGRSMARQADRERLADQELRARIEQGNNFRQLAGQARGAQTPAEREPFISQAYAADPQGAMALERQLGQTDEQRNKQLTQAARALVSIPEENHSARMWAYQQMRPSFLKLGLDAPAEYTPETGKMAEAWLAQQQQSGQVPAQLQYHQAMTAGLSPEDTEQARRVALGLEARPSSAGIRYMPVVGPDGRTQLVAVDPREIGVTSMGSQFVSQTPGEKAAQEAQAKAGVELATAPEIAQRTAQASQLGKNQAEQQETQRKNQTAFSVYSAARDNLQSAMAGTDTGPLAGRLPAVTSAQQIAEGAGAAMAPVLKQLFREAGEGTFTEGDQKLLTDMLPKRTDHPEVVTAKLGMIDQIIAAKLGSGPPQRGQTAPPSGAQRQPTAAPSAEVTATGPNGQKLVLRNGQWQPLQ